MSPKAAPPRRRSNSGSAAASRRGSSGAKSRASRSSVRSEGTTARAQPPVDPLTMAVIRLQAAVRAHLARRYTTALREARRVAEHELLETVRLAELAAMRSERRKEEEARERELERQRKKRELEDNTARLVAAAFDGDLGEVTAMLRWGVPVDARNRRGVTALSEAACGGASRIVLLLLAQRGDPNCKGEFGRSPLWRASYQGYAEVVSLLLEHGADPRIGNDDWELPIDVTSSQDVETILSAWDVSRTDALVLEFASWRQAQQDAMEQSQAHAMKSVEVEFEDARALYITRQKELVHLKSELRRRIREHDLSMTERKPECVMSVLRKACEASELKISAAEGHAIKAQQILDEANVRRLLAAEEVGVEITDETLGRSVMFKDLDDVLIRDIGGRIASSSKWPLILDTDDCAMKFLKYSGHAVLNCWCADEMQPDRLRRAMLSMLRGGGVFAINLLIFGTGTSLSDLAEPFEDIRPGLFGLLLSKQLLLPDPGDPTGLPVFHELVDKDRDGEFFEVCGFAEDKTSKFKFALVTSSSYPHSDLLEYFDVMRLKLNVSGDSSVM